MFNLIHIDDVKHIVDFTRFICLFLYNKTKKQKKNRFFFWFGNIHKAYTIETI